MKKLLFILFIAAFFSSASQAFATVGGPTYLYSLKYNPADTSVYYLEQSHSGKGCPPVLNKVSVSSLQKSTVISCDQGAALTEDQLYAEIYGVVASFKDLTQINLTRNNIKIDIAFDRDEKVESGFVSRKHFTVKVFQDDVEIGEFKIYGCNLEQPFLFGGYAIPGLTKKIAILLSAKGDCWEGGYTYETLHIVNANVKDRSSVSSSLKNAEPLTISEATLTEYVRSAANNTYNPSTSSPTPQPTVITTHDDDIKPMTIVAGLLLLALGVTIGLLINKRRV